jgi:hypothetical protein
VGLHGEILHSDALGRVFAVHAAVVAGQHRRVLFISPGDDLGARCAPFVVAAFEVERCGDGRADQDDGAED